MSILEKFARLATDNAPGQEVRQTLKIPELELTGPELQGVLVDFSHGDVDAHRPTPGALKIFCDGVARGGAQAYTEYRGDAQIRIDMAQRMAEFTGAPVDAEEGLIITPGTQGALFLAVAATIGRGDKIAIVQPDYFANRKLAEFFDAEILPVQLPHARGIPDEAGIDLSALEDAFKSGASVFLFSNPNNPCGVVYSRAEITQIASLANHYGATVIVDQLYSRLRYTGTQYSHLRTFDIDPENLVTIMGPSKTESLSGYRLGVAFGSRAIISRMEKLQAIVSLRAAGYSQAVLRLWFAEPEGWLEERIHQHQAIRDDLMQVFGKIEGCDLRMPMAGSYLFPRLPAVSLAPLELVQALRVQGKVIVTPGAEFSPHTLDCVRLNFSQDHDAALDAAKRIAVLVERYRA